MQYELLRLNKEPTGNGTQEDLVAYVIDTITRKVYRIIVEF